MTDIARPKKLLTLYTPHEAGSLLDCAGIVSALLRTTKTANLTALEEALTVGDADVVKKIGKFYLSDEQVAAIERHHEMLERLSVGNGPTIYLAECNTCGAVSMTDTAVGSKCNMALHCEGKPVKSSFAKQDGYAPPTSAA